MSSESSVDGAVRVVSEPAFCRCFCFAVNPLFNGKIMGTCASSSGPRNPGEREVSAGWSPLLGCKLLEVRGVEFNFVFPVAPSSILPGEEVGHVIPPSAFWEGCSLATSFDPLFPGSPSGELAGLGAGLWATTFPASLETADKGLPSPWYLGRAEGLVEEGRTCFALGSGTNTDIL